MTVFSRFSSTFVTIAVAAGLLLAAGFGSARAQTSDRAEPGMLPDHPMYFTTSMSESVGTFFTFGEVNQAERSLELSERRLAEARALAANGQPEEAERAVERYQVQLDRALSKAKQAEANGDNAEEFLTGVSEATPRHQKVLAEVYQKVPEQARPGIERAMEASRRGGAQAGNARRGTSGQSKARGLPDSAGPPAHAQGKRPPPSRGQGPPDYANPDRPGADERPDSSAVDTERPDTDRPDEPGAGARPDRGKRGPPDSVETGRPDSTGGR